MMNYKTLIDVIELRKKSDKGLTLINDKDEKNLLYKDLYKKSLETLYYLQCNGVNVGDELIFQIENNEEYICLFWACILGGIVPVPLKFQKNDVEKLSIMKIWKELKNPYLVTTKTYYEELKSLDKNNDFNELENNVVLIDEFINTHRLGNIYNASLDDIAYIQFSSGSTGNPKGVILTHENLLANVEGFIYSANISSKDSFFSWMPLTHNFGLILYHILPLIKNLNQYIMETSTFIENPVLWIEKVSSHKATILSSPNFGFKHFLDAFKEGDEKSLDLSSVRIIINGGEPISSTLCNDFLDKMSKYNLKRNTMNTAYGMSEATVAISITNVEDIYKSITLDRHCINIGKSIKVLEEKEDKNAISFVSVGFAVGNCEIRICDEENRLFEDNIVGEIQVKGRNVTKGYYNNKAATNEIITEDGWLNTGDLGFISEYGLVITGRKKDIIIVNGKNYYPYDLEKVCQGIEEIKSLCVVIAGIYNEDIESDDIVAFIPYIGKIEEFIEIAMKLKKHINKSTNLKIKDVIPVESIPKTSSGKVQRYKLQQKYQNGDFNSVVELIRNISEKNNKEKIIKIPSNEVEKRLKEILEEILQKNNIDIYNDFFELGLDSLTNVKFVNELRHEFNMDIKLKEIVENSTIKGLAKFILNNNRSKAEIECCILEDKENINKPFSLTNIQSAYFMGRNNKFELGGTSTHFYLEFKTELNIEKLNYALLRVIERHPMLRAVMLPDNQQMILKDVPKYKIEIVDISSLDKKEQYSRIKEERDKMSHQVFDMYKWPLFEFKALKFDNRKSILFVGFDMLICDGASIQIIGREIMEFYKQDSPQDMDKISVSYRDYMLKYGEFKNTSKYLEDKKFWLDKLEDFPKAPDIPLKQEISKVKIPKFKRKSEKIDKEDWIKIKEICKKNHITASALLCTIYSYILSSWSNSNNFALNMTTFNRHPYNKDIDKVVGDFTSVILVDVKLKDKYLFWENAKNVQNTIIESLEHRDYDGVEFIREISNYNNLGAKAIMPIVFTSMLFGNNKSGWNEFGELQMGISQTSQVLLDNQVLETNNELVISWDYVDDLFQEDIIDNMFKQYIEFIYSFVNGEKYKIGISNSDREIIEEFNNTKIDIKVSTLHELFMKQVINVPKNVAVIFKDECINYEDLDKKSNQIANYLIENGIGRNELVGVIGARRIGSIINILGILKSGAAYVPIDPSYPEERKKYIIENSKCKTTLEPDFYEKNNINKYSCECLSDNSFLDDLAYVIYTSGSTGKPKGVAITHRAAANTIVAINEKYSLNERDRIIGLSSMCFDLSVYDIFGALSSGATLVQIDDQRNIENIMDTIKEYKITIWNSVPAIMDMTVQALSEDFSNSDLRLVLLSGDWISLKLPNRIKKHFKNAQVTSLGGATEAAIWSIYYEINEVKPEWSSIPYGKPLANQKFYVISEDGGLCPVGVKGELYIEGVGLAQGYVNDEKKTKRAFIKHPILGYLYKTGDYGVLRKQGYIEFFGRRDDQVKVNGYRIELGEIEKNLISIKEIENAIVVDYVDSNKNKYVCAYIVCNSDIDNFYLRSELSKNLPQYMIPRIFMRIDEIPLTLNSKLDKKKLPKPEIQEDNKVQHVEPRNNEDKTLVDIWKQVLNKNEIGIYDNFFELGGDSIKAIQITSKAKQKELNISLTDIYEYLTIANIVDNVNNKSEIEVSQRELRGTESNFKNNVYKKQTPNIKDLHEPFKLTQVQMAYLMGRNEDLTLGGISTHFYGEFETEHSLELFNENLQKLINHHPALRTIIIPNGEQKVLEEVPKYEVEITDLRNTDEKSKIEIIQKARDEMSHQIFESDKWPLFEFKTFKLSDNINYICMSVDLMIADGGSFGIMEEELKQLFENPDLELQNIDFSFRDYVNAFEDFKTSSTYLKDKEYWQDKLAKFPLAPAIPLKNDPNLIKKPYFSRKMFDIKKEKWDLIKNYGKKNNITPSAILCTIYSEILAHWSNQPDLAINLTVFNRYPFHEDVEKIVGDFTSIILLDVRLKPELTFWENAKNVQHTLMKGLEHRHYDGVEFIRDVSRTKNLENVAAMPIVFTSMLFDERQIGLSELSKKMKYGISQTPQVYIDCQVTESEGNLKISWDYVKDLFEDSLIENMFNQYVKILNDICNNQDDFKLEFSEKDLDIIDKYNETNEELQLHTLDELISKQAKKTPNNIAIVLNENSLTYQELDSRSNQVARYLIEQGIERGDLVGVITKRDVNTIMNIVGILKVGAGYVPIDPEYPDDRKNFILENSKSKLVLQSDLYMKKGLSEYSSKEVLVEHYIEDVAYVIHTSGSTGRPKGVVVTHKAASNTIIDMNQKYSVNENDRFIGLSSMCFDLSVYDIFGALISGAMLVMIEDQRDVINIMNVIEEKGITIWNSVPAIMDILIENTESNTKEEIKYYWSPIMQWEFVDNKLTIDKHMYPEIPMDIFPEFYFVTQKGITVQELISKYPEVDSKKIDIFINELIENRVLVNSILKPEEIFSSQDRLFKNNYSERILYDTDELKKYKYKQLNRDIAGDKEVQVILGNTHKYESFITNRRTCRRFKEDAKIPFNVFSKLISVFKQSSNNGEITYYYASAGGLYPIDIYIYIKEGKVENLEGGLYYYSPITNCLKLINEKQCMDENCHYFTNKDIFESSSLSIFMIYNAEANMPKYGGMGYLYAAIDAGIMISTLTQVAELLGIGLCSIGNMNFSKIEKSFNLNSKQQLIHSIEVGINPNSSIENKYICDNEEEKIIEEIAATKELINDGKDKLRLVLLSGDWIPMKLPNKIRKKFNNSEVISLGGATEAAIWSIYYPIDKVDDSWKSIPYGKPLANQKIYILNYAMELCPIGVIGEICIFGLGLANGYLNDKEKTEKAFVEHPILGRIYKTGDYGILHKDGYVEFLGRRDNQIKIRGFRIEIGEIENCLMKCEDVNNAIVVDFEDEKKKKHLCAYIVSNSELNVSEIRSALSTYLPNYMIPQYFVKIDSIPLTNNGKVNKKGLPVPTTEIKEDSSTEFVVPQNELEEELAAIWRDVLGLDEIGINDNFFEIGGDSVLLIKAYNRIQNLSKCKIKVTDIFAHPTIEKLAKFMLDENQVINKNTEINSLTLSDEYFNKKYINAIGETFKYEFESNLLEKLVIICGRENVNINDILLSMYVCLLEQINKKKRFEIQVVLDESGIVYRLEISIDNIKDLISLFSIVKNKCKSKSLKKYAIQDASNVKTDKNDAIPLFINGNNIKINTDLLKVYDLVFRVYDKKEKVGFTLEYNGKLKTSKVRELVNGYIKLIKVLVNNYEFKELEEANE